MRQEIIAQVYSSLLLINQFVAFIKTKIKHVIFLAHTNHINSSSMKREGRVLIDKYWWCQSSFEDCHLYNNYSKITKHKNPHFFKAINIFKYRSRHTYHRERHLHFLTKHHDIISIRWSHSKKTSRSGKTRFMPLWYQMLWKIF